MENDYFDTKEELEQLLYKFKMEALGMGLDPEEELNEVIEEVF